MTANISAGGVVADVRETILSGPLRDQAALFGVMMKARDLGLALLSVNQVGVDPPGESKNH